MSARMIDAAGMTVEVASYADRPARLLVRFPAIPGGGRPSAGEVDPAAGLPALTALGVDVLTLRRLR